MKYIWYSPEKSKYPLFIFFYFQVKSSLCKINVVILLHSVELLIVFHHTSLNRKANLEYNYFLYILTNDKVCVSLIYIMWKTINMYQKTTKNKITTAISAFRSHLIFRYFELF